MVSERCQLELTVARLGGRPRRVEVSGPADAEVGEVLDALGVHLGLARTVGALQASSRLSGDQLSRSVSLGRSGLLRGEQLDLTVGLDGAPVTRPPRRWSSPLPGPVDGNGRLRVHRPPRSVRDESPRRYRVPPLPTPAPSRRFPIGAIAIPLLLGLLLVVVTRRPEIALFAIFSPIMVLWNVLEERRTLKADVAAKAGSQQENLEQVVTRATAFTAEWAAWLRQSAPGLGETLAIVDGLSDRIWERRASDVDYLRLRLGTGERHAPIEIDQDPSHNPDVDGAARVRAAAVLSAAPVVAELFADGVVSIIGSESSSLARSITLQLAALHSPRDLALAALLPEGPDAEWLSWLPHVGHSLFETAPIASEQGSGRLLRAIASLVEERHAPNTFRAHGAGPAGSRPDLVVLVDERCATDAPLLVGIAEHGPAVGVFLVWIGAEAHRVPGQTTVTVTAEPGPAAATWRDHRRSATGSFTAELLHPDDFHVACLQLAPLTDSGMTTRATAMPSRVSLQELQPQLGVPGAMRRAWDEAPRDHLHARLGRQADGEMVIDLGPSGSHVLIGGTTGSGKSELLQTLVTSLAAQYPPDRVAFLLVDYKGGAAFKDAKDFPHTVGLVTDLDGHLTRRVLASLDAEIRRREGVLRASGARDLAELRANDAAHDPGDLIIIVDEFAALSKEIPEFVEGVVDLAARGRSLGIRLVLATQRPAGVINDRIRANVGVRIALRVNDESDSFDVLDAPDAARISRSAPGRGFARIDRDFVEFQSAYVGSAFEPSQRARIEIHDLEPGPSAPPPSIGRSTVTLLGATVEAANRLMSVGRWQRPHVPWLPALPPVVSLESLQRELNPASPARPVLLGRADQPESQLQRLVALDFDRHQNVLIFGSSRSGKTTALRTIAAGCVSGTFPSGLHLYALDFAGQGLQGLTRAPQCAAVITSDQLGRIARLLRRLRRSVDERRALLAETNCSSFAELMGNLGPQAPARTVVLLDSYTGAAATLERHDGGRLLEALHRLVADGAAVGLHFVITADRRAAVPGVLTSIITTRLVLRMAEKDDYALLGVDSNLTRDAVFPAGRGVISGNVEIQVAVLSDTGADRDQWQAFGEVSDRALARLGGWRAPELAAMPTYVSRSSLKPGAELTVPLGIGEDELAEYRVSLAEDHFLIAGPARSGRSAAVATIVLGLLETVDPPLLVLFAPRRSPLTALEVWHQVVTDVSDRVVAEAALAALDARLAAGGTVVVVCDDVDDFADSVSAVLEGYARRGREQPIRFIAAADNRAALRSYSGLLPELRRSKNALLLSPDLDIDGDLVGVRLRAAAESPSGPGRGYAVRNGVFELVQVAM